MSNAGYASENHQDNDFSIEEGRIQDMGNEEEFEGFQCFSEDIYKLESKNSQIKKNIAKNNMAIEQLREKMMVFGIVASE